MCSCQTRTSVLEACGHQSRKRIPCGKARLRASNFLCQGSLMSMCKSEKLRMINNGLCNQCEAHFRPFRINDPGYVEKYIAYKQAHGLGKVDVSVTPLDAIFARFDMRRLHGKSPMRATPPHDSKQPSPKNSDCENAASDWSRAPALAESCVGDIFPADVYIYLFSDLAEPVDYNEAYGGSQRKGRAHAQIPGLYRGGDVKDTALYVPCHSVLDSAHPVPMMGACPRTALHRRPWSKYAKAEWVPARRPVVRSRSTSWVPVPRSEHREIFRGCPNHGSSRVMGCTTCRDNSFKEQGVPAAVDARAPGRCQSAPPHMVRITNPGRGYTCAAQAICFCDELRAEKCLPCSERNDQVRTLQARFI